jgi:hypothetical protein
MSGYQQGTVTPIDMLPELQDIASPQPYDRAVKGNQIKTSRYPGENILSTTDAQRVQKFIRENHVPTSRESGMMYKPVEDTYMPVPPDQMDGSDTQYPQQILSATPPEPNCVDCAKHAAACPVCKSYFNNDKTILYICIAVLLVICLLLLKKVLDM